LIVDTHSHYFLNRFDCGRETILEELHADGFCMIESTIACNSNEKVLKLCETHSGFMRAVLGCHPTSIDMPGDELSEEKLELITELARKQPLVVGIGEVGLDYMRVTESERQARQRYWLERFVETAVVLKKPLVIHCRGEKAYDDLYEILNRSKFYEKIPCPGVIHCFSGNKKDVERFGELGLYFGIGGLFLRGDQKELREAIGKIPLNRILLETDSPYLIPDGLSGKRNTSNSLKYIVSRLAGLLGADEEKVYRQTLENTLRVFPEMKECVKSENKKT